MMREPKIHLRWPAGQQPMCNHKRGAVTDVINEVTCKVCLRRYATDNREPIPVGSYIKGYLAAPWRVRSSDRMFTYLETLEGEVKVWGTCHCWDECVPEPDVFIRFTEERQAGGQSLMHIMVSRQWERDPQTDICFDFLAPIEHARYMVMCLRRGWHR